MKVQAGKPTQPYKRISRQSQPTVHQLTEANMDRMDWVFLAAVLLLAVVTSAAVAVVVLVQEHGTRILVDLF